MRRSFLLIGLALLAFVGGLGLQTHGRQPAQSAWRQLPPLTLPDLAGQIRRLNEWQGKIIVLNFWATWCPPCRKEIPEFVSLQQELGGRGLQFIGIAIDEPGPVEEYVRMSHINYPILIAGDHGMALAGEWGNTVGAVPFSVIIAPDGTVVARHPGELTRTALLAAIEPWL